MSNQVDYYNQFATKHRYEILGSDDPSIWTTDIEQNGPIFQEMKKRIQRQKEHIVENFAVDKPVLDLGCGFGRQSFMMAKSGFRVVGVDNSSIFIEIADTLFDMHRLEGNFICSSILDFYTDEKFEQILLLDVLEHFKLNKRIMLLKHIAKNICSKNSKLLVTFPSTSEFSIRQKIDNLLKYFSYYQEMDQEHPYYIPNKKGFYRITKDLFSIAQYQIYCSTAFFTLKLI
jgi:2-polyprenyl-3-methyl-5-hydroxy-6-metoxy-1,4-benzoquinol methylase